MSKDKIDTSDECFGVTLSQNNVYLKGDKMNKYVRRIFVDVTTGSYIDTVHKELCQISEEQNRDDKKCYYIYYTNFNGHEIDSTMNIDEVYSILDINKNEEEVNREETNKEERLKNFADIAQVYYFKLNNEQQKLFEDINWFKIVNHSIYRGKECVAALHIVSMFNENKDISEIKKYCDSEGFSGYAWNIVVNLVHELDLNISHQISNFYVGLGPYKAAEYLSLVP
jgi:hypothetical protein